jgi:spore germination protein YaaH
MEQNIVQMLSSYCRVVRWAIFINIMKYNDCHIGTTGTCGAVANVSNIKNPVCLARTVADNTQVCNHLCKQVFF